MEAALTPRQVPFHGLKIAKKELLTKNAFSLELDIPQHLRSVYSYNAGQYVRLRFLHKGEPVERDFSMTSAPYEPFFTLGIRIHEKGSSTQSLFSDYHEGDLLSVSEPMGRFTLESKPHEFRTIVGFAAGIGITPLLSHFKTLLYTESRTRLFLFYSNSHKDSTPYLKELKQLESTYPSRFQLHLFYSRENPGNPLYHSRLNRSRVELIINQVMMLDDTDEESTLWDSVDEVLICGPGEMIREVANACYENGIPKKNIHFELFEAFNEDIFPVEVAFPLVEDIEVEYIYQGKSTLVQLEDNRHKLLQSLSSLHLPVPFSCKSGICGSCICQLEKGEVELLENEYLTPGEEQSGKILPCMAFALSKSIKLNFDNV